MAESSPSYGSVDTSIYRQPQQENPFLSGMKMAGAATALQTGQFDLHMKQLGAMRDQLSALLADPNLDHGKVIDATGRMVANGLLTPQQAATELGALPRDPAGLRQALTNHLMMNLSAQERLQAVVGTPTAINNGASTGYYNVNPLRNTVTPMQGAGASIPNQLSPGQKIEQQQTFQNGQPGTVSVGARFDQYGNERGAVPMPAAPQGGPAGATMAPRGMAPAAPAQPAAPGPVAQAGTPGFNPTGAPLGVPAATERTAAASAEQGNALQAAADGANQRKAQLQQLEQLLGQTNTGPVAGALSTLGAAVNQGLATVGSNARIPGVADKEEFQKIASQLQAAQAGALGGTDAAKALAGHTNPSLAFSTEGNKQIIQMLKGQEDAISAKNAAWQEWKKQPGHGPDTYGAFQQQFNKDYEPRAFVFPYLSPEERTKMLQSMTPSERSKVKDAIVNAEKRGWIKAP